MFKLNNYGKRFLPLLLLAVMILGACTPKAAPEEEEPVAPEPLAEGDMFELIPGSKYWMGSWGDEPGARGDESPQHKVILPSFWVMQREVTNNEYEQCVKNGACTAPLVEEEGPSAHYGDPMFANWPVNNVDWFQAVAFCEWMEGRLPTEAEWEKAARGKDAWTYPWGEDAPSCDLLNMAGCKDDTEQVLKYPGGKSPYHVVNLSGNVREWTADWYQPDYYELSPKWAPSGPPEGELKVTRGGSWDDGEENVRSAARIPMDPHEQSALVGFRCVPAVRAYAPICPTTFGNFCDDPEGDGNGEEPCIPGEEVPDCGEYSIASFGCPDDEVVCVSFSVPPGSAADYEVNIGGDGFSCSMVGTTLECCGPEQPMGTNVTVTVCGPAPEEGEGPAVFTLSEIMLASYSNPLMRHLQQDEDEGTAFGFCPDGYHLDQDTGECVQDEERRPCPDGWHHEIMFDEETQQEVLVCILDDPLGCPPPTTYDEERQGCVPDDEEECPEGFVGTPDETCEPPHYLVRPCLPGYWYDEELGCCVPLEDPCEDDEYLETRIEEGVCEEPSDDGCPVCTVEDTYYGVCVEIPGCIPGEEYSDGLRLVDDCYPDDTVGYNGECDPPPDPYDGEDDCGEDYVLVTNPDGTEECVPIYGPDSGCPPGYILDPRTLCCVPLTDPCISDGEEGVPMLSFNGNGYDGSFNPYGGDCEEDETDEEDDCPPGTYPNDAGVCIDSDGDPEPPDCPPDTYPDAYDPNLCHPLYPDDFECPDDDCWMVDTAANACLWICDGDDDEEEEGEFNPCDSDDLVWIPELRMCLPLGDDCCEPGYDWSYFHEMCMPIFYNGGTPDALDVTPGTDDVDGCPPGYELVDGYCMLFSRRSAEICCWTISINPPLCIGGCEVGYIMDAAGNCVRPQQPPGPTCNCGAGCKGLSQSCCGECGCTWDSGMCF